MVVQLPSIVKDVSLATQGELKIEWASQHMPVLRNIRDRFKREQPFRTLTIGMCMHLEMKTAVLGLALQESGAMIAITGSNPLSTQDDVAASLSKSGANVFAWRGVTEKEHHDNLLRVLETKPDILIDDGGELSVTVHTEKKELMKRILGACEETTTGVHRYRAMERDGILAYPVMAVNDAFTKFLFDSQHGTGQSALEGIMRATNLLIGGKNIVVAGYGWVGRGIALRARGLGAEVIVTEVDPIRALEAAMEGFRVMPMLEAAKIGDIFVSATGDRSVLGPVHFNLMRDGAILCNAGHFDVEIDIAYLNDSASKVERNVTQHVDAYVLPNRRTVYVLGQGRLVNLACAEGHPAQVMDMSFATQALAARWTAMGEPLPVKVHEVP